MNTKAHGDGDGDGVGPRLIPVIPESKQRVRNSPFFCVPGKGSLQRTTLPHMTYIRLSLPPGLPTTKPDINLRSPRFCLINS